MADALHAAEVLAAENIDVEVIDVATLAPLDATTILTSVAKTGRAVIVHEAAITGGYGGEIAARISATDFYDLESPISRVAGYDTVMPLARLEARYMPNEARILAAVRDTVSG